MTQLKNIMHHVLEADMLYIMNNIQITVTVSKCNGDKSTILATQSTFNQLTNIVLMFYSFQQIKTTMAVVRITLCAVFMVTVAFSKPVSISTVLLL